MYFKFGTDNGNSGAIIRWGKYLDNGIWFHDFNFKFIKFRKNYIDLGFLSIMWSN
jgi:hypothetical protein